jgi:alpha-L-rhamnosidase
MGNLKLNKLRCEYLINPLGIDIVNPRLSWILESDERNQKQMAYQILVASTDALLQQDAGDLWDTGKIESDQSNQIAYQGKPLKSCMFCYWKVRVWDKDDSPSAWSEPVSWSMGLLEPKDWKAQWIGAPQKRFAWFWRQFPKKKIPSPLLRKSFSVNTQIKRALVYVTALGEYQLYINGKRVGERFLAPEWTDYDVRVQYQTYDITEFLQNGDNVIGVVLADGWYAGHIGLTFLYNHSVYGINRSLLLQLVLESVEGNTQEIVTDATWKLFENGPIRQADHFKGETHDIRQEQVGWNTPGFDDTHWTPVTVDNTIKRKLVAQMNEPIRNVKEVKPIAVTEPKPGLLVFNLGQNIAGWCKVRLNGAICEPNATISLRHAEMLKDDGTLYTTNLKTAWARDKYILKGVEDREYHPCFTYHGFQYTSVKGLKPGIKPPLDMIIGCAIASDAPLVGEFECSDATLNKLWSNILWTQRDNMISVPTDCPQRDERLGWMADAQVFCQTSIFNMDMAAFYTKWVTDIRDAQMANGKFPDIAPNTRKRGKILGPMNGAPAWTDAGVIVPWCVYLNYGDKRILEQHYASAKKLIEFVHKKNPNLLWKKGWGQIFYNDWLNGDTIRKVKDYPNKGGTIPKDVFATAYFAHSTELVSKMAEVLGLTEESKSYADLAKGIKAKFTEAFVTEDGTIKGDTQAGYALALFFNLLPDELRPQAISHLVKGLEKYDWRISTGFCSTLPMMLELTKAGYNRIAYQLLLSQRFPSWFYMINQGATTMWERWDGYVKGRGFQNWLMNSFNHYSIGAVGEWIYKVILGINLDENQPGYKHILIKPQPGGTITWAKGHYNSIYGKIEVSWKLEGDKFNLEVTIPPNTTATIHIPAENPANITESGQPIQDSDELQFLSFDQFSASYTLTSGTYQFQSKMPA